MIKVKPNIINALLYIRDIDSRESITSVALRHDIQRHTLARAIKNNLLDAVRLINGIWWKLSHTEQEAIEYFRNNSNVTYREIYNLFKIKHETFRRMLDVHGIDKPVRKLTHEFNRCAFRDITTEFDAYWLGFILADGYVNENRGVLNVKLGERDLDHLKKFCDYLGSDYSVIKKDIGGSGNMIYSLTINSRGIINNLVRLGVRQRKSGVEVPYYIINNSLKKHYIRGIIDGDGWIRKRLTGFGCVGSEKTLLFIVDYFDSIVNLDYRYIAPHDKIMKFEIRNSKIIKELVTHLYKESSVFLERKMILAKKLF